MADIFLSYKRADAMRAKQIAALLEAEGWSVWWDTRHVGGERWDAIVEREIGAARCVIVIWSPNSVDSVKAYWVHLEARHGRERGMLVPVAIGGAAPPFAFSLIQARDLTNWDGASRDGAAADFIAGVRHMLEDNGHLRGVQPQPAPAPGTVPAGSKAERKWRVLDLHAGRDLKLLIGSGSKREKGAPVLAYGAEQEAPLARQQASHEQKDGSGAGAGPETKEGAERSDSAQKRSEGREWVYVKTALGVAATAAAIACLIWHPWR
jgi:hypothetical protein